MRQIGARDPDSDTDLQAAGRERDGGAPGAGGDAGSADAPVCPAGAFCESFDGTRYWLDKGEWPPRLTDLKLGCESYADAANTVCCWRHRRGP